MTALNYVSLVLDEYDGAGNPIVTGSASLVPNQELNDSSGLGAGPGGIPQAPVTGVFRASGLPSVRLLATDNAAVLPRGWAWTLTWSGVPGNPAGRTFYLPFSGGATQYLSQIADVTPVVPALFGGLTIDGGSAVTGQFPVSVIDGGSA